MDYTGNVQEEKGSVFRLVVHVRTGMDLVTVLEAILTSR